MSTNGEIVIGDVEYDGRVVLYIIKADQTSYINYIKPLIFAEELQFPHVISVIDTTDEWYYKVHPERYVPALKDEDPQLKKEIVVFEGTACLQYLAERFDVNGDWSGRNAWEKAQVLTWVAYQTSGLGPTAKYWLYFLKGYPNRANPESLPKTVAKLHSNCLQQWDILDKRLSHPEQHFIALPDRPTIADLSYFPFAMPLMFTFFSVDIKDWPNINAWSERMLARPAVSKILQKGPSVLTRPEDVKEVFKDSDRHIKAVNNNSGWLMGEILGKCVGLVSQNDWHLLRTVTEVPFLHTNTHRYIELTERRTRAHFANLHQNGGLVQGLINPVDDLKFLPFWIVSDILYGNLSPELEAQLQMLIPLRESLFRRMIRGGLPRYSWSRYLPTAANAELSKFKTTWASFNDAAYKRSSRLGGEAAIAHFYSAIESGRVGRDQVLQTLDEMLFANLDVTIGGISWNLLFIAADKESQSTLRHEIVQKRAASKDVRDNWKQYLLSPSTYLAASILESSRLKPLAAFSVPQAAPTTRQIDGFSIPAGMNFIVDSYALNVRNPYWGEDSSLYRPSRFLDRKPTDMRYNFWRFGFGPRQCMGKYLADLVMKILLIHLLEHYELSLLEHGKDWDRNPETWITHPDTDVCCKEIREQKLED
ncbi:hypothetical protein MMC11_004282 [Xylographa trunciseda]|nr:hypothetical protein [Xylographa trunciseda]